MNLLKTEADHVNPHPSTIRLYILTLYRIIFYHQYINQLIKSGADYNRHINIMNIHEARIYVGTYAKYNNGSIGGEWLTLKDYSDKEEFYKACAELHEDEQDPEFMFQDHEYIPAGMVSESHIEESFWDLLNATADFDEERLTALFDFIDNGADHTDPDMLVSDFEEAYQGNWDSEKEYAEQLLDDCYNLDEMMGNLSSYFDYDRFARDLFMTDYWMSANGNVFRN